MSSMVKLHASQGGPHGRSLSRFLWHEAIESIATPPGWDVSPSQGYVQQYVTSTHFIHLGGERRM